MSSEIRIVIVDDEPRIRRVLERILHDYNVVGVDSGQELFQLLEAEQFDLILCDMMMPGMTGIDIHNELRRQDIETPIAFVSGGAFTADVIEFLERVDPPVIDKPFSLDAIHLTIAECLK